MHSSRLTRVRSLLIALLAVFAFGVVAAAAAQAEEAPRWTVNGNTLGAGETRGVVAKAVKSFVLSGGGVAVTCTKVEAKTGSKLLGSAAGEPGTSEEVLSFSGCSVTGNGTGAECNKVTEPITTNNLTNTLVEETNKKGLLVLFQPAGAVKEFVTLKFPKGCKFESTKVTGSVVAAVYTDPGEVKVELPTKPAEAVSWLLKLPETQPEKVWSVKGGTGSELKIKAIEAFGVPAVFTGTGLVSLLGEEKWSPLP